MLKNKDEQKKFLEKNIENNYKSTMPQELNDVAFLKSLSFMMICTEKTFVYNINIRESKIEYIKASINIRVLRWM